MTHIPHLVPTAGLQGRRSHYCVSETTENQRNLSKPNEQGQREHGCMQGHILMSLLRVCACVYICARGQLRLARGRVSSLVLLHFIF